MTFVLSFKLNANPAELEIIEKQDISLLSSSIAPQNEPLRWFIPAKSYWLTKNHNNNELYRNKVHLNELGLRITASDEKKGHFEKHLFFVGCSFTMGQGVENYETFSYQVSKVLPHYQVRNFGFRGAGIQDLLYFWQHLDLQQLSSQKEGLLIITLIPDHFSRLTLGWRYLDWAFPFATNYEVTDQEAIFKELLSQSWKYRWANQIKDWGLSYWWLRMTHAHSLYLIKQSIPKMPVVLESIKKEYLKRYPRGRFIVTWMLDDLITPMREREMFYKGLKERNIEYWEAKNNFEVNELITKNEWHISHDDHPTNHAHKLYAKELIQKIKYSKNHNSPKKYPNLHKYQKHFPDRQSAPSP